MDVNPYESPQVECISVAQATDSKATDWFSLAGLFIGTIAAVAVGLKIGNTSVGWLVLGITVTLAVIAMSGWLMGQQHRRNA
jgi:hypothetical protein